MYYDKIPVGKSLPDEVFAIIEISSDSSPIKYEFNKEYGCLVVDRFIATGMRYPCNYGFIPHTFGGDGDPLDILVVSSYGILPGSIVPSRPIGALVTEDEGGMDEKVIAIPVKDFEMLDVRSVTDLSSSLIKKIEHFFSNYKNMEPGKWVKVSKWIDKEETLQLIKLCLQKK
ncbi:Inorganic pyrophosphatase [Candidatus Cyrtobacter comes]|uniref:Inorganic pyrophosphatase n=1 Tax=Candidatus Cyrtobacter comes TaxID=675776 RepID=A0ABU5L6M4_9RICK|nr:inorganic diphosphatase [Candidatus Cyrtobacter comes]MDZ5761771.1 Inorganic pyrophosphatase [Candidatus Cyrtobacter comes]